MTVKHLAAYSVDNYVGPDRPGPGGGGPVGPPQPAAGQSVWPPPPPRLANVSEELDGELGEEDDFSRVSFTTSGEEDDFVV